MLRLWLDPRVSGHKKLLFPLLIGAYWVLPDILPFLPVDDLLFTLVMAWVFTASAEKEIQGEHADNPEEDEKDTIDVSGEVVDETKRD